MKFHPRLASDLAVEDSERTRRQMRLGLGLLAAGVLCEIGSIRFGADVHAKAAIFFVGRYLDVLGLVFFSQSATGSVAWCLLALVPIPVLPSPACAGFVWLQRRMGLSAKDSRRSLGWGEALAFMFLLFCCLASMRGCLEENYGRALFHAQHIRRR
jgi:hypothetical protein